MSWEKIDSKYLIDTKWLKVRQDSVKLPNGTVMDDYMVIENKNVSLIVAINDKNEVILKSEYRYPINKELIELPGGTFELCESNPLEVAKRELLEETGYSSEHWELLCRNYDYPTKDINQVNIYLARDVKKVSEQTLDESEDISFQFVPMETAVQMCMNNRIEVNGTLAGIFKAARILGIR